MDALNILATGSLLSLTMDSSTLLYIFIGIFVIAVIIGLSVILNKSSAMSTPTNIKRISGTQVTLWEALLSSYYKPKSSLNAQLVPINQKALVNFAPLTVMNAGYAGPAENGVYSEEEVVAASLKAGARCFILPIDYHDNSSLPKPAFPNAGEPCLLYRDSGGVIRSLNAGSISKVAQALANLAFNDIIPLKNDPSIVVLYFVKTPQQNTKEYLRYCSQVAKALNPLIPFMLGQAPEGVYNRQGRQDELLYTAIPNLEKKVILMSNIDTTIFRTPTRVGIQRVSPQEDLDFMVHLRLFGQTDALAGATEKVSPNQFPRGYLENFTYYSSVPQNRIKDIADNNRIRWVVTIPGSKLSLKDVKTAIDSLGIQAVGLDLYSFTEAEKPILNLWKESGWKIKPNAIRFTRPDPIKPKDPSPKLNANKGQLSSPTI